MGTIFPEPSKLKPRAPLLGSVLFVSLLLLLTPLQGGDKTAAVDNSPNASYSNASSSQPTNGPTEAEKLIQSYRESDQYSGKLEMNGIRLDDFKDFFSWDLVTVRYRTDTNEQRFTYANKLALKSLLGHTRDYPDGSIFVKVGYLGEEDKAFPSSVVPSGLRRVQIMVRNKAKYDDTGGWGYALFKMDGTTFGGDPKSKTEACAACHNIVRNRGFVFSQPIDKTPLVTRMTNYIKGPTGKEGADVPEADQIRFRDQALADFSSSQLFRLLIPQRFDSARLVTGDLSKTNFVGTYNEIIPSLIREALRSGKPSALVKDGDESKFSLVYPLRRSEMKCNRNERPFFVAMRVPPFYLTKGPEASNLEVRRICERKH